MKLWEDDISKCNHRLQTDTAPSKKKAMKANGCERAACLGEDGRALSDKGELENQRRKQMWDVSIFRKLCHVRSINTNTLLAVRLSIALPLFCVWVFVTATAYDFIVQTSHRALKHPLTWHNTQAHSVINSSGNVCGFQNGFWSSKHQQIESSELFRCWLGCMVEFIGAERLRYLPNVAIRHVVAAFMHCIKCASEQLY